jgi:hypothetical protein
MTRMAVAGDQKIKGRGTVLAGATFIEVLVSLFLMGMVMGSLSSVYSGWTRAYTVLDSALIEAQEARQLRSYFQSIEELSYLPYWSNPDTFLTGDSSDLYFPGFSIHTEGMDNPANQEQGPITIYHDSRRIEIRRDDEVLLSQTWESLSSGWLTNEAGRNYGVEYVLQGRINNLFSC